MQYLSSSAQHSFLTPNCYTCTHVVAVTNLLDMYTCLCSYQFVSHVHVSLLLPICYTCTSCLCSHKLVFHVHVSLLAPVCFTYIRLFPHTNSFFMYKCLCSHQIVYTYTLISFLYQWYLHEHLPLITRFCFTDTTVPCVLCSNRSYRIPSPTLLSLSQGRHCCCPR